MMPWKNLMQLLVTWQEVTAGIDHCYCQTEKPIDAGGDVVAGSWLWTSGCVHYSEDILNEDGDVALLLYGSSVDNVLPLKDVVIVPQMSETWSRDKHWRTVLVSVRSSIERSTAFSTLSDDSGTMSWSESLLDWDPWIVPFAYWHSSIYRAWTRTPTFLTASHCKLVAASGPLLVSGNALKMWQWYQWWLRGSSFDLEWCWT